MDAPKRIWINYSLANKRFLAFPGKRMSEAYDCRDAYVLVTEHERVVAELEAQRDRAFELTDKAQAAVFRAQERWSEARNEALEDAAQMLLRRFHSMGMIEDFAAAIRAMKVE